MMLETLEDKEREIMRDRMKSRTQAIEMDTKRMEEKEKNEKLRNGKTRKKTRRIVYKTDEVHVIPK